MFRRPDDDDDDYSGRKVIKPKPIAEKYAKKLGSEFSTGKTFVTGSDKSQKDFYGSQQVRNDVMKSSDSGGAPLTEDEKNKLSAKILKAEMKGDTDLVKKLKRKLESGISGDDEPPKSKSKEVTMMRRDREGNILPASSRRSDSDRHGEGSSRMRREYEKSQDLDSMVREEKTGTAGDQLRLFERSLIKSSKIRRHDDESVDDIAEMQKGKKKSDEKDKKRKEKESIKEHKRIERSFDDCSRCIDSSRLKKHNIIAVGINTYLAVVEWDGLDDEHLIIVPTQHCSSTIQLDENVWDEMRLWRKGLVALWKSQNRDCIFFEMSRHVDSNPHVFIECVPVEQEIGDMASIYFKKAINECEGEYMDNKKLIETKDLRRQIPKGFSYFAVDFGLSNGFAHVIESHDHFPSTFATEIIAGMLDLPPKKWRKRETDEMSKQKSRAENFKKLWEPVDWTKRLKNDSTK